MDQSFNRNYNIPKIWNIYHEQIATICYYILLTAIPIWHGIPTCVSGNLSCKKFARDFMNLFTWIILACNSHTIRLPNLFRPNSNSITCVEVHISSKKVRTRKCFKDRLCDHIHDTSCRPDFSTNFFNVTFQLIPFKEFFKSFLLTSNRELRICRCLKL